MNDREQESKRLDSKRQPKINGKGRKQGVKDDDSDSDEGEDNDGDSESSNDEDGYDDTGSQKRFSRLEANFFIALAKTGI